VTAPLIEPITLAEVKEHLRIDGTDRDTYMTALITTARQRVEEETRRAFIRQQWTALITGDLPTCHSVELPRPRLIGTDTKLLEYRNTAGTWTAYATYSSTANREPAQMWLTDTPSDLDTPDHDEDAVWRMTYWAGYGTTAASVPGPIKHAIMILVAHLHERPEIMATGYNLAALPKSMDWLLDSYKTPWEGLL